MFSDILGAILTNLAIQLPVLIAMLVGIIIAIATWKRNPKSSLFALIAIVLFFILRVLGAVMNLLPYMLSRQLDLFPSQIGFFSTVSGVILNILDAGAWGLLLAAIFSGRKAKTEQKS